MPNLMSDLIKAVQHSGKMTRGQSDRTDIRLENLLCTGCFLGLNRLNIL
jgi:hypothetical protein